MHEQSFTPLLVVVGAAMLTGILLPRLQVLRIPLVVGEILIGIVLGKSGAAVIPETSDPWLELLSLFGFAFLMFLSGLEINLRALSVDPLEGDQPGEKDSGGLKRLLMVCLWIFAATLVTSLALSFGLVALGFLKTPYIMALIMSTTSVGLVMPLLKERGEGGTPYGQAVILSAVIADFSTMLLITVVVTFYEAKGPTMDVLVIGTLFLLFFVVLFVGQRLMGRESGAVRRIAFNTPKTAELPVRASMTLMLGFVVFSQVIGTEIILGAFLAGTAISSFSSRAVHGLLGLKLDAIGFGFFIPIFFIMVGARFDLQALFATPSSLILVPLLVLFAFLVKVVPSLLFTRFFGRRDAVAAGFMLSSRLSLIIAASAIGLRIGAITPEINTAIIMVAIISCVLSPAIYAKLRGKPKQEEQEVVDLDAFIGDVIAEHAPRGLELQLAQVAASDFPFLIGKTLAEAQLRQSTGLTLIALVRTNGDVVDNPGSSLRVEVGDRLFLIGSDRQVEQMEALGRTARAEAAAPEAP